MRPIRLEIEGLRSFRATQVIDFTGRDYLAIIGDTGAGKSSILEAMTFALFGRTTFSGQGHQELMNSSSTSLRVVFSFDVGGEVWVAARTLRRAGSGLVSAGLVSLTQVAPDGSPVAAFEGARQATAQVERVLGLDADAFLRTVVLPQGQFSRLLVDDDQRQRSGVLRQIWRTDELTEAGALADAALRELTPLQARVAQALTTEPPDPDTHLAALEADLVRRDATWDAARSRHEAAAAAARALEGADLQVRRCDAVLVDVSKWDGGAAAATAAGLAAAAARSAADLAGAAATLDDLARETAAVPPDDDGYATEEISRFRVLLQQLPGLVGQRDQAERDAAGAGAALDGLRIDVETTARAAEEAATELSARTTERAARTAAVEAATTRRSRAGSTLDAARRTHRSAAEAEVAVRHAEAAVASHRRALGDARAELDRARHAADATTAALRAAQRADAAATAAHGLHAGDPCPVCDRPLEPAWVRPAAPGLAAAEQAARDAAGALDSAQQSAIRLEGRVHAAEEAAASGRDVLAGAIEAATLALGELEHDLAGPVDLSRTDADLLAALDGAVEAARVSLADQEERIERARLDDGARRAAKAAAEAAHRAKADELAGLTARRDRAVVAVADHLAGLPEALRPAGVDVDAPLAVLAERQSVLAERQAARERLAREIEQTRVRQRALEQARTTDVDGPAAALWTTAVSRAVALERAATDLGRTVSLPDRDRQPALDELPAAVALITAASAALAAAAHDLSRAARTSADDAVRLLEQLAEAAGPAAGAGLAEGAGLAGADHDRVLKAIAGAAEDAAYEARTARAATEAFRARLPVVASLRLAAANLDARILALSDLAAALRDGAFPKWLTLRRSRSLLVHASRLLSEISGGRYAFAELDDADSQWSVFDSDHGQPRSPASLSGGEKFVASLALALGMVEMMGRQGDRIGSLFLDEGFGALDRTNLDAAVEALGSVAATGRMVAVITHLSAVAEQIDDILAVTCGATGTRVAWLDAAERAALSERSVIVSERSAAAGPEASVRSGLLE